MTNFVADRREQLREDGLEALREIVRAIQSHPGTGQVGKLVRFVAGCYNSSEYPFELDQLRGLDTKLAANCLTYLAYDAPGEEEIHHHIAGGGEAVTGWFEEYGLKPVDPHLKDLRVQDRRIDVDAKPVTYGHTQGYRSMNLVIDVEELGGGETVRMDVNVTADDSLKIRSHIDYVHRAAWEGTGPIDWKEGEQRAAWLK